MAPWPQIWQLCLLVLQDFLLIDTLGPCILCLLRSQKLHCMDMLNAAVYLLPKYPSIRSAAVYLMPGHLSISLAQRRSISCICGVVAKGFQPVQGVDGRPGT